METTGHESLVFRIFSGDRSAETEIVRHFTPRIFSMAMIRLRDSDAARDVVQETLLGVIRALREGRLRNPEKLAAFVAGATRNVIRQLGRENPTWRFRELGDEYVGESLQAQQEEAERIRLMHRALEMLDTADRQIISMTFKDGLKSGEIAAKLGQSSEVVRTRKVRAIRRISELIQKLSRM